MRKSIALAASLLALGASSAAASTGTITRAYANATWTNASIAGSVTWDTCTGGSLCSWFATVTAQPTLPSYYCRGDEPLDSDPNTTVVWSSGDRTANATLPFDVTDGLILYGVVGQRLCLIVTDTTEVREPVCVAQAPILGYDPNTCPFVRKIVGHVLTGAQLTLAPTPPPSSPPPPADTPDPVGGSGSPRRPVLTRRQKLAKALRACGRRKTRAKRVSCRRAARRRYGA